MNRLIRNRSFGLNKNKYNKKEEVWTLLTTGSISSPYFTQNGSGHFIRFLVGGPGINIDVSNGGVGLTISATGSGGPQGPQGFQGFRGFQGFQGFQGSSGTPATVPVCAGGDSHDFLQSIPVVAGGTQPSAETPLQYQYRYSNTNPLGSWNSAIEWNIPATAYYCITMNIGNIRLPKEMATGNGNQLRLSLYQTNPGLDVLSHAYLTAGDHGSAPGNYSTRSMTLIWTGVLTGTRRIRTCIGYLGPPPTDITGVMVDPLSVPWVVDDFSICITQCPGAIANL